MRLTLYHYVHCPFCVRVRMTFGYLDLFYESKVLRYDDEETPVKLSNKKMLPILAYDKGFMNESLDIMAFIDQKNSLRINEEKSAPGFREFEVLLNLVGGPIHSLAMPYWIYTPEFDEKSRAYFQTKKEEKRGPFKELVRNKQKFISTLENEFPKIISELKPFYQSNSFGLKDIMLASHLWGLYIVPEFQFPEEIHHYLQLVKTVCKFDYHQDFWR